ncbi:MAG: YceI family protein [Saprospiraceae bacterium]|nr:YceI family protein [Saprospiraceae bacterium]
MKFSIQIFTFILLVGFTSSCKKDNVTKAEVKDAAKVEQAEGVTHNVVLESSKVMWEGTKPGGAHNGTVDLQSGSVTVKDGELTGGSFVMDMNTITDQSMEGDMKANLEAHLKGTVEGKEDDFFNVTKFPTSKFEITKVTGLSNDPEATHLVYGNLTIRDITKQVGFKASIKIGDQSAIVQTPKFSINRADFGIKFMSKSFFDNLKDKYIDDDISLQIRLAAR